MLEAMRFRKKPLTALAVIWSGLEESERELEGVGGLLHKAPMKEGLRKALFSDMLGVRNRKW